MGEKKLDSQLDQHLEEVISSRKVELKSTKQVALNLWSLICSTQKEYSSRRIVVQHFQDGKIITTLYSEQKTNTDTGSKIVSYIDNKLVDYWNDPELLPMLSIIAENSSIDGRCRLNDTRTCRELHLVFK